MNIGQQDMKGEGYQQDKRNEEIFLFIYEA